MRLITLRLAVTLALALLAVGEAQAQFKAAVQGVVTDPTGAVIPNATITLKSIETGREQQTVTNETGFYRLSGLAPGSYTISAEAAGFKRQVIERVNVGAEELRGVNFTLEPGQVTETVTVSAEAARRSGRHDHDHRSTTFAAGRARSLRADPLGSRHFRSRRAHRNGRCG